MQADGSPKRLRRRLLTAGVAIVLVAVGLVIGIVLVGLPAKASKAKVLTYTMFGDETVAREGGGLLPLSVVTSGDGTCTTGSDYSDIAQGTPVNILDGTGVDVGAGVLSTGHSEADGSCDFDFVVANLPYRPIYRVGIGTDRGLVSYSFETLRSNLWIVSLTLGTSTP